MAFLPCSPSCAVSFASPTSAGGPAAATAAVPNFPASSTELQSQAVARTPPAEVVAASCILVISQPTRSVALVSTHSSCKSSRDDDRSSPAERVRRDEDLLQSRLEIHPTKDLAVPLVDGAACNELETAMAVSLPPVSFTGSFPRTLVST